jgi:hypothetical protein
MYVLNVSENTLYIAIVYGILPPRKTMKINYPHISGSIVFLDRYPNVHGKDYGNSLAWVIKQTDDRKRIISDTLVKKCFKEDNINTTLFSGL